MKITFCSEIGIPNRSAAAISTMKNCESFAGLGHEVLLLVPNITYGEIEVDDIYKCYGVEECFAIQRLPWLPIPGRRMLSGLFAAHRSKKQNFDLVYSRSLQASLACTIYGIPTIFESHAPVEDCGLLLHWQLKTLLRSRRFVKMVVITGALKKYYQKRYGIPDHKIQVVPDAGDDVMDVPKISFDSSKLQVGYVGQLFPGKGAEIIMELARICPWADFHCIGGVEEDIAYWRKKN